MKVRWRQHELILACLIATIALAAYSWGITHTPIEQFSLQFAENGVSFSLYRNLILPDIGLGFSVLCTYLFLYNITVPRLLVGKKVDADTSKISFAISKLSVQGKVRGLFAKFAWLSLHIIVITVLLGTAADIATYYRHEWQFNYPEFSIFFNKANLKSQLSLSAGFGFALIAVLVYLFYALLREIVVRLIESSGNLSGYRALICNRVTAFLVFYISIAFSINAFNLKYRPGLLPALLFLPVLFLFGLLCRYWIFPMIGRGRFLRQEIVSRLLITSFSFSIPFIPLFHEGPVVAFLYSWAILLFIVTPVNWIIYQQGKDKILQLRGAEKELTKSKADLKFLQSQINPHFLFNILNTLYGTAMLENATQTATGIQQLGDMMRFMLHENNLDFIAMNKEIEYLKNYIALQRLRTGIPAAILIEENIGDLHCDHKIAPMLLIPFVENAFKHGISLKQKSWIKIGLQCSEREILFEVRNSVHPSQTHDPEKERGGIGLSNVEARLKLIYPGKFSMNINKGEEEYFVSLAINVKD